MCNAGGECAQGDQRVALPRRRLDRACGVVEASNQMRTEREPVIGSIAKRLRWHFQHPTLSGSPAGREIGSVLVPGAKPARPAARHIHSCDNGVFPANTPDEINCTVDQYPPEVRVLALAE